MWFIISIYCPHMCSQLCSVYLYIAQSNTFRCRLYYSFISRLIGSFSSSFHFYICGYFKVNFIYIWPIFSGFWRFSEIRIKPGHIFEKMTWGRGDQKMSTFHDSQNQNPKFFVNMCVCMYAYMCEISFASIQGPVLTRFLWNLAGGLL